MKINTENSVSVTEANENFSKVARMVDEKGSVVILKNNKPKYLIIEFAAAESISIASDEEVKEISKRLLETNKEVYEALDRGEGRPT